MDSPTRQHYEGTNSPINHKFITQAERNGFWRDRAIPVSLVHSMHLTGKHIFALFLLIPCSIEAKPGPTLLLFVMVATGKIMAPDSAVEDGTAIEQQV